MSQSVDPVGLVTVLALVLVMVGWRRIITVLLASAISLAIVGFIYVLSF